MSNSNHVKKHKHRINYYTDGSLIQQENGKKFAAYSFIKVLKGRIVKQVLSPVEQHSTSNCMELKAVLFACKDALEAYGENPENDIYIFTDSAYVYNSANERYYDKWLENEWKNSKDKPVANKEYWEQLIPFLQNKKYHICKVRGHGGNIMNTFVNNAAQNTAILAAYGR